MRIVLVQPDAAAAELLIAEFAEAGYEVVEAGADAEDTLARLGESRPYAVVVFLDRDAPTAVARADELMSRRKLRNSPLLFAGGTEDALESAEKAHPRASFTRMEALQTSLASIRR